MPKTIAVIGRFSAVIIAAKPLGKPVNRSATTRMSQTWLASQMGPMAAAMACLCRGARDPAASRYHMPPPKSAPPMRAYRIRDNKIRYRSRGEPYNSRSISFRGRVKESGRIQQQRRNRAPIEVGADGGVDPVLGRIG